MSDTPAPRQKRGLEHWGSAAAPGKECTVRCGRGNLQAHLAVKWAKGPGTAQRQTGADGRPKYPKTTLCPPGN